jgi:hypothetical protein
MTPTEESLAALDQRHAQLLEQIDELDRQIEQVLADYLPGPSPTAN